MSHSTPGISVAQATSDTLRWLERAVIGLNLCPFAKSVYLKKRLHIAVSEHSVENRWRYDLKHELQALVRHPVQQRETTLLVLPNILLEFHDFNQQLDVAEQLIRELDLEGQIQIASFHPHYQFAGTQPDDISNYSNRSPHPTLHLLRESSIDQALDTGPPTDSIYQNNIRTLEKLGHAGWNKLGVGK